METEAIIHLIVNRHRIIRVQISSEMVRVAYAVGKDTDRQAGQMSQFRVEELSQLMNLERYELGTYTICKEKATAVRGIFTLANAKQFSGPKESDLVIHEWNADHYSLPEVEIGGIVICGKCRIQHGETEVWEISLDLSWSHVMHVTDATH